MSGLFLHHLFKPARRRPHRLALILLAWAPVLAAQTLPTSRDTPAKTLQDLKAEGVADVLKRWGPLEKLPARPVNEIVLFTRDADHLVADSPYLRGTTGVFLVPLADSPVISRVAVSTGAAPGRFSLQFEYYDYSPPDLIERHLQVLVLPGVLQIAHDTEFTDKTQSISLLESVTDCTVRVQIIDQDPRIAPVRILFSAPTFGQLRMAHPAEFNKYLRPIFREIKQEPVAFAVDEKIAWQAMADTWQASPALAAQVNALVKNLNDEDYKTRDAADKSIRALGGPAAIYLMKPNRASLTPEQKSRVDSIVHPYQALPAAQLKMLRADVDFALDCLNSDNPDLRIAALEHLRQSLQHAIPFDVNEPAADRAAAVDRLRDQLRGPSAATTRALGPAPHVRMGRGLG